MINMILVVDFSGKFQRMGAGNLCSAFLIVNEDGNVDCRSCSLYRHH